MYATFIAAFLTRWVYTHADEIPIDFALPGVLALAAGIGRILPRRNPARLK